MPTTTRLLIPLLVVGQATKEVTINDALNTFDAACVLLTVANDFTHAVTFSFSGAATTWGNGSNMVFGTGTGTKIGTSISQKLAFYNSAPIVQPSSTTDLRQALINLGLYATGGASPLDLNGGALTAASATITTLNATAMGGDLTISTHNIVTDTSTGTKIGTATSQKLGFYNATPIVQPSSTTDLRTALINLGLYATGGASPLDLNGGALTATGVCSLGATTFGGNLTVSTRNIVTDTSTGTQIATSASQKLGFFAATPIVQPSSTTDLRTALINLGLYASGGATPLDLNGGALTISSAARANFGGEIGGIDSIGPLRFHVATITFTSDADKTLATTEVSLVIIDINTDAVLTAGRNLIVTGGTGAIFIVRNRNAQIITVKTSGGTGIAVGPTNKIAALFSLGGVTMSRLTADTVYTS